MKSKRKYAVLVVVWGLLSSVASLKAATPWLHTDANMIKDPAGNVVVLRGIDTIDLGEVELNRGGAIALIDRITDKTNTEGNSPGWYPRVIRLAVYPSQESDFHSPFTFTPGSDTYYNTLLRPVIDYCKTKDLYVIIDWHFVGDNTYDRVTETSTFWAYMAPRFANDSHVLFELFQEPGNITGSSDADKWLTCRNDMQTWINIVRTYAPNNLILVSGPSWSQIIGPAATYPLTGDNIVMVSHIYPGHWLGGSQSWYTGQVNTCLTRYPVFMSEWGFRASSSYSNLQGTISNYGQPISDFREARKISGSAWITDYSWEPQMFNSSWTLLVGEGEMGGFTKDLLYLKRNDNQPSAGDTTPPAAPTGLSVIGDNEMITLDWNDNSDSDLYGYDIYRSTTSGSGYSRINLVRSRDSNYTDSNITLDMTYYYVVTAIDTSFNTSDASDEVSATATDTTPPAIPSSLMATCGNGMVLLNWNDNTEEDLDGYNVYRSETSGSDYVQINGPLSDDSIYIDSDVTNETTYYYVVTATDIYSNESGYSSEVSVTPSVNGPVVYNYAGIAQPDANYNAYICDVDQFPFGGDGTNRNTFVEATNAQYINIADNDSAEWASPDAGTDDEIFFWVEMKINEPVGDITKIDLAFNGYTSGPGIATHKIYVLKAGTDWTQNSSWVQVGSDQNISPGAYAVMTRSITSNISTYIDSNSRITWGVFETTSSEIMHVNYLEMAVFGSGFANYPPTVSVTSPADGTIFAKDSNVALAASSWDKDGIVTKVEFYAGSTKLGEDTIAPYSYAWNNVPSGLYVLTAKATDDDSSTQTSAAVNITVLGEAGTGAALCEWWTGISGTAVSDLTSDVNYPDNSTGRELLLNLEGPINWADNYGTRIRGYLYPVADGNYTFWIAGDDSGQLWLSTDDNPANVSLIAYVPGAAQSSPISLAAGQKYYIEVLHKEGTGNDNISVSWQGPGISQQIIDGVFLSPCCLGLRDFTGFAGQWKRNDCNSGNDWCEGFDFNRNGSVLINDLKSFAENWLAGID